MMKREGKLSAADALLDYGMDIELCPVKSEPTQKTTAARSHMDEVAWPEHQTTQVSTRTVLDI